MRIAQLRFKFLAGRETDVSKRETRAPARMLGVKSWDAGGMLVDFPAETPSGLRKLATASARMYPEFVHELEDESGLKIDLRSVGTLLFTSVKTGQSHATTRPYVLPQPLAEVEPALQILNNPEPHLTALYIKERS